jgi:hypothetical protein
MKKLLLLFGVAVLLTGCDNEVPLTYQADIPVDNELLGLWEFVPSADEMPVQGKFTMLILKFSNNEYLIKYCENQDVLYFKGYIVKLENLPLIQLECIGFKDETFDDKSRYSIVKYTKENNNLRIEILNPDVISRNCKSSEELRKEILANKNNKELFRDPGVFKK